MATTGENLVGRLAVEGIDRCDLSVDPIRAKVEHEPPVSPPFIPTIRTNGGAIRLVGHS